MRIPTDASTDIAPKSSEPFTAAAAGLKDNVRPAISVDVTLRFEKSGDLRMRVPIEACPAQQG